MSNIPQQPNNKPGAYDAERVAVLQLVWKALEQLQLPPIRLRKLNTICNALEMQIEDGGDSPEVNDRLLEALQLAVIHQVGQQQAQPVLQAIDNFAQAENMRRQQVQAGTGPSSKMGLDEKLNELMQSGYELLSLHQTAAGCDYWLRAWELVKKLATPDMRRVEAFDDNYSELLQSVSNWSQDLEMELHNAGVDDPVYAERRIRYVQEYLAQFPEDEADRQISFRRAEGEALWRLGRIKDAETVYQQLVETYPDHAWGYIGWSDQYYMWSNTPHDYKRAEKILRQALARPTLDDPDSVQNRLTELFEQRKIARQKSKTMAKQPSKRQKFRRGRKRGKK